MGKIIGISGRKQAGKNTVANILHGIVLKEQALIEDWNIGKNGQLLILTSDSDGVTAWGEFDVSRKDDAFIEYAELHMWPFVKLYSFADSLKWICTELFNIPYECVWGTNNQKNKIQNHLLWENMPGIEITNSYILNKNGPMTSREFMQYFGTNVMRKIYEPIWINSCINKIKKEGPELAIIADVRFANEIKELKRAGGIALRLTRNIFNDNHECESALDADNFDWTNFDHIIDNKEMSIDALCNHVKDNKEIWS